MGLSPRRFDPFSWPPVWLALFGLAAWLAGRFWPIPTYSVAGWLLVLVGAAIMGIAAMTMIKAGATVDPTREPTALVTHGIFRWSRNPIYLADAIILCGLCLIWQPVATVVLVPAFIWVITSRFIKQEEAWLTQRDPAGFAAWAKRTRRWL